MSWPLREVAGRRLEFGYRRFGTVIPSPKFKQSKQNYLPDTTVSIAEIVQIVRRYKINILNTKNML